MAHSAQGRPESPPESALPGARNLKARHRRSQVRRLRLPPYLGAPRHVAMRHDECDALSGGKSAVATATYDIEQPQTRRPHQRRAAARSKGCGRASCSRASSAWFEARGLPGTTVDYVRQMLDLDRLAIRVGVEVPVVVVNAARWAIAATLPNYDLQATASGAIRVNA
jgi:hypothetical protein